MFMLELVANVNVGERLITTLTLVATSNSSLQIEDEQAVVLGKLTIEIVMVEIRFPIAKSYVGIAINALFRKCCTTKKDSSSR